MARRFRFPLETLLKVRRLREREARRKVGAKRAEIARLDRLDEATRAAISSQQSDLLLRQSQVALEPRDLVRGWAWIAHLRHTLTQRQLLREKLVSELTQLLNEYREARKQTRIIEKLRERRWEAYRQDRQHHEQADADELAQQLHQQTHILVRSADGGRSTASSYAG